MRFAPVSLALSIALAVSASSGHSAQGEVLNPRAAALEEEGRAALAVGEVDRATDAFEAALAVQPGSGRITLALAEASRRQGMQGKALHYYRVVLTRDPANVDAIAGEGEALAEKGALDKAKSNLAKLQGICGAQCEAAARLSAVIAKGPNPKVVSAADVAAKDVAAKAAFSTN